MIETNLRRAASPDENIIRHADHSTRLRADACASYILSQVVFSRAVARERVNRVYIDLPIANTSRAPLAIFIASAGAMITRGRWCQHDRVT